MGTARILWLLPERCYRILNPMSQKSAITSGLCNQVFEQAIADYHIPNHIDAPEKNPHPEGSIEHLLYHKNWVDTVQWHFEDEIRSPDLSGPEVLSLKRRIDSSNQVRTDTVELIDDWFLSEYGDLPRKAGARQNSETPAWLIDRMSILALKVYHWREQTERTDVDAAHKANSESKLAILLEQQTDLARCLDELVEDFQNGSRYMKVYRQMKMYNDEKLNPVLYGRKKK